MAELQNTLPSGWDCQYDRRSGRYYYVNHFTKTTTWEDPRLQQKTRFPAGIAHPMPLEHIVLQHGSPEFRRNYVYPSQITPIPAFQIPAHCSPKSVPLQDLGNTTRSSPRGTRVQDSSLSNAVNTEEAVTKISTMFPTVSDTHIRLLLKKYMKFIFPKAEEMMILDILSSNDNNIQKASEILLEMGFQKRDNSKQRVPLKPEPPKVPDLEPLVLVPIIKSVEDKKIIQSKLEEKYKDVPGQVITIALDSVDFDENRAHQILETMVQEENDKIDIVEVPEQAESAEETLTDPLSNTLPISQSRQSLKSLLKTEKSDYSMKESTSFSRIIEERSSDMGADYKSPNIKDTNGANRNLVKGANQELLLEDYVKWQGPQPRMYQGASKGLAKGPNPSLRISRTYQPCGPNSELRKGPKFGLAKGSIFTQLKGVIVGESRGK